ncbi:hypothetical protein BJX61DRAFT_541027 [Aspergillus egyptiacus]|nr:hypothetical protein BJX61DRAFT_541027 [Aspergillus egyptiacus]
MSPPAIVTELEDNPAKVLGPTLARIYYNEARRHLLVKPVGLAHEEATRFLSRNIEYIAHDMNLGNAFHSTGSALMDLGNGVRKCPDSSWLPRVLPAGRTQQWPSVVVEVGHSDTTSHLRSTADLWIERSAGQVNVVILVSIKKGDILVEKWVPSHAGPVRAGLRRGPALRRRGQSATCQQGIRVVKTGDRQNNVVPVTTGAPLIITFEEFFLRAPNPPQEHDIVISSQTLEIMATDV